VSMSALRLQDWQKLTTQPAGYSGRVAARSLTPTGGAATSTGTRATTPQVASQVKTPPPVATVRTPTVPAQTGITSAMPAGSSWSAYQPALQVKGGQMTYAGVPVDAAAIKAVQTGTGTGTGAGMVSPLLGGGTKKTGTGGTGVTQVQGGGQEQPQLQYGAQEGAASQQQFDVMKIVGDMHSFIQQHSQTPNTAVLIGRLTDQALRALDQAESQMMAMFQQAMGGMDPATQNALALLRESIGVERERLQADLNRRGLLQSGIALEVEQRFRTGALLAEEQIIAEQFRGLQTQMFQALMGFAQQRLSTIQQMGALGVQAGLTEAQMRQQAAMGAMQYGLQAAGLGMQQQQFGQQFGLEQQRFGLQQQMAQWERDYRQAQLGLQQQQLAIAGRATELTPQQQLANQAYQKLMQGYTMNQLTEGERLAVGQYMQPQQVDMNRIYQQAAAMAQQDIRVLTGQATLNQVAQEYANYLQGNFQGGGGAPPPTGQQANYWPGIWNQYGLIGW